MLRFLFNRSGTHIFVLKIRTVVLYLAIIFAVCCTIHLYFTTPDILPVSGTDEGIHLPILMYHGLTKDSSKIGKFVISQKMFEQDLQYLKENGYNTVTVDQVIDYVKCGEKLPEKPIILTFDDGYYNNYCYGFPLLKENNMKAVISPIGKYSDLYSESDDRNPAYAHIGWDEIKEMIESGLIEFQNHSYDLHHNTNGRTGAKKKTGESLAAYGKFLEDDLMIFQEKMRENTGYTPTTFTYPYGGISEASYEILERLGFQASLSCEEKINIIKQGDLSCLRKMNRYLRSDRRSAKDILEQLHE